jgi:hypothetical protein
MNKGEQAYTYAGPARGIGNGQNGNGGTRIDITAPGTVVPKANKSDKRNIVKARKYPMFRRSSYLTSLGYQ